MGHILHKKSWSNSSLFNHRNVRKLVAQTNPRSDRFPPALQKVAHDKIEGNVILHTKAQKENPNTKNFSAWAQFMSEKFLCVDQPGK